ncbi:MAG: WbqC family protein [Acidobacteria bacterium]|nr:WbqC family protein [Acidobacteriota bacterium]
MVLGLMQPYFFPYLGYVDLMRRSDVWVVFDTAQYISRGWVNRNRILHPAQGWQYITVPVARHALDTPIRDIEIARGPAWATRIEGQLQHYRRRAPYFDDVLSLVHECLRPDETSLLRLNVRCLAGVCTRLGVHFEGRLLSEMGLALGPIDAPGDWSLRVAQALGLDECLNPPGGRHLYAPEKFAAGGVRLTIQEPVDFRYDCAGYGFEPSLSMLDVLMWNSPADVRAWLDRRRARG